MINSVAEVDRASVNSTARTLEIDGLRGWASVSVMIFHVFWEMFGAVVPGVRSPITAVLLNPSYAVMIFFVLSGDALSSTFFTSYSSERMDRLVIKRYLRLTIPIFLSCLLTWVAIRLAWDFHEQAAIVVQRQEWLGRVLKIEGSVIELLRYSFYGVYAAHTTENSFNPFLWTMSIEMIGSLIVFLVCYVWRSLKEPRLFVAVLSLFLLGFGSFFCLFLWGMLIADARSRGFFRRVQVSKRWQMCSIFCIALIFLITGIFWKRHFPLPILMLAAGGLVFFTLVNRRLVSFFGNGFSLFLGRLSFSLYLVHFFVIITLMSFLVVKVSEHGLNVYFYLLIGCLGALCSVLLAWVFMKIDVFLQRQVDFFIKAKLILN